MAEGRRRYANRDAWVEDGAHHRRGIERHSWALGDWLVAGMEWDVGFVESQRITGYSSGHLFNLRRVALAFPPDIRTYAISLTAHLQLLRERDPAARRVLYDRAIAERWTPEQVIAWFTRQQAPPSRPTKKAGRPATRKVKCPHCGEVFPLYGHEVLPGEG